MAQLVNITPIRMAYDNYCIVFMGFINQQASLGLHIVTDGLLNLQAKKQSPCRRNDEDSPPVDSGRGLRDTSGRDPLPGLMLNHQRVEEPSATLVF